MLSGVDFVVKHGTFWEWCRCYDGRLVRLALVCRRKHGFPDGFGELCLASNPWLGERRWCRVVSLRTGASV